MKWTTLALLALLALIGIWLTSEVRVSMNRAAQKRTLATMHYAAERFEQGKPIGALVDGWKRPMRVHVEGKHYSLHSAAADGKFESRIRYGQYPEYERDIVLVDGQFLQMPEGI